MPPFQQNATSSKENSEQQIPLSSLREGAVARRRLRENAGVAEKTALIRAAYFDSRLFSIYPSWALFSLLNPFRSALAPGLSTRKVMAMAVSSDRPKQRKVYWNTQGSSGPPGVMLG